jgi:hypothetical protein
MWTSGNLGREPETPYSAAVRGLSLGSWHMESGGWPDLLVLPRPYDAILLSDNRMDGGSECSAADRLPLVPSVIDIE